MCKEGWNLSRIAYFAMEIKQQRRKYFEFKKKLNERGNLQEEPLWGACIGGGVGAYVNRSLCMMHW